MDHGQQRGIPLSKREQQKFDHRIMEGDLLGVNLPLARSGATYRVLRKMPKKELITYMDTLIMQRDYQADVDFYLQELLRREHARTNTVLTWLAVVATVATVASVIVTVTVVAVIK